jgi:diguanylate cyclase (GGDEF)-like protein
MTSKKVLIAIWFMVIGFVVTHLYYYLFRNGYNIIVLSLTIACACFWYIHTRNIIKQARLPEVTDKLTKISNRETFINALNSQIPSDTGLFAVILIDINDFSSINNLYGSNAGDQLLFMFGQRIVGCFGGDMFARVGGDEFAILVKDSFSKAYIETKIEKIIPVLQAPFYLDKTEINLSVSIGVSICSNNDTTPKEVMRAAGIACHNSKLGGKGTYLVYDAEMNVNMLRRMRLQTDLPRSLDNNDFLLYYQPQIDSVTHTVVSVEALIRWDHPELGRISPVEFIPIAEKSGLILQVDEWVFRTACIQSVKWRNTIAGNLKISVNFSMQQFRQAGLIPMILRIVEETGADISMLNIEITETAFMQNVESTILILEQLNSLNITISLDDFGTGFSSLSYLRQLPVSSLKLDKSFVDNMLMDKNGGFVAKSIIALAHDLDLEIVAEGVESHDQLDFLIDLGCEKIQGFLFSPPITPEELEKMLVLVV